LPAPEGSLILRKFVLWYTPVFFFLASSLQAYPPRFTAEVSAHASAVYTLACLSRQIPCTRTKFQERENSPAVAEWKAAFAAMPPISSLTFRQESSLNCSGGGFTVPSLLRLPGFGGM
jgi:hypothetical protein